MVPKMHLLTGFLFAFGIAASNLEERKNCPSGTSQMAGIAVVGGTYNVCCPGSSVTVEGAVYCCVGGNDSNNEKRDVCIGDAKDCQPDYEKTSSCVTAVPVTARDYSSRVSSATATMTSWPSATGAATVITVAPWAPWLAAAGGAAHAALMV
ncbi:hypothetical protein F4805DRAFT_151848 [Annulohypoxylon moriforme]|nr:hypothetical protein F4805DRAFT_151848 [Annulohypoxylon moriforme]